jgi:glycosyltransferase involved in cell wall biosynthesis
MALNNKPLVSVIAVSYNHGKYIKEAIESLLTQDYYPLEIIISDDHSNDDSFEIAQKIASEYKGPPLVRILLLQIFWRYGITSSKSGRLG